MWFFDAMSWFEVQAIPVFRFDRCTVLQVEEYWPKGQMIGILFPIATKIYPFITLSRLALGSMKNPLQYVPGFPYA
jgi:hypothetical protein